MREKKIKRRLKILIPTVIIFAVMGYYYGVSRVTVAEARQIAHTALLNAGYNPKYVTPDLLTVETCPPDIPNIFILHPPTWLIICAYRDPNNKNIALMKRHGVPDDRARINVILYVLKTTGKCTGIRETFDLEGHHQEWIRQSHNFP